MARSVCMYRRYLLLLCTTLGDCHLIVRSCLLHLSPTLLLSSFSLHLPVFHLFSNFALTSLLHLCSCTLSIFPLPSPSSLSLFPRLLPIIHSPCILKATPADPPPRRSTLAKFLLLLLLLLLLPRADTRTQVLDMVGLESLDDLNLARLDLLKVSLPLLTPADPISQIDAQGMEQGVLLGARHTIRKHLVRGAEGAGAGAGDKD